MNLDERKSHKDIITQIRQMIMNHYIVEDADENTLFFQCQGFYLQISFTDRHPLMCFQFVRELTVKTEAAVLQTNSLNLRSVLGTHAVNCDIGCYIYRTVHWLECPLLPTRFSEILQRCTDEANRGYISIASA